MHHKGTSRVPRSLAILFGSVLRCRSSPVLLSPALGLLTLLHCFSPHWPLSTHFLVTDKHNLHVTSAWPNCGSGTHRLGAGAQERTGGRLALALCAAAPAFYSSHMATLCAQSSLGESLQGARAGPGRGPPHRAAGGRAGGALLPLGCTLCGWGRKKPPNACAPCIWLLTGPPSCVPPCPHWL